MKRALLYATAVITILCGSAPRAQSWQGVEIDRQQRVRPELLSRALRSYERHRSMGLSAAHIAIVDFAKPSSERRLFLVDLRTGAVTSFLVAHGRGSDPDHDAIADFFSDAVGSLASSLGSYRVGPIYQGAHGLSVALDGLEPSNRSARARAVVMHSQWYVSDQMVARTGKLGRSWGCFVVDRNVIGALSRALADGGFLYAAL